MIGAQSGQYEGIIAVYLALVLFGVLFNSIISYAERRTWLHGYVSLAVAGGVLITLAGVAIIDYRAALISLGAFIASGIPMMLGSVYRHVREREEELERLRRAIQDDD